ncbi:hypothetical protein MNBD_GAMMA25-659 [hydrothermal vent metagenome]|uniref:DUF3135 domain-containing protein n=1 Tax=hydrothermal vent metagenome TaxID=652676 RepID=A0A3B1BI09_9ZZZZ
MSESQSKAQIKEKIDNIDFEHWSEVARVDPAAFEAMRTDVINACINNAPRDRHQRLRGLQWQIDCLREKSSNPLSACIKISSMMWDTMQQLGKLSQKLNKPEQMPSTREPDKATVLAFRPLKNNTK